MTGQHPLAVGQTWIPTKPGTEWRHLCEVSGEPGYVRYQLASGYKRAAWAWEFRSWCDRFQCILKPTEGSAP